MTDTRGKSVWSRSQTDPIKEPRGKHLLTLAVSGAIISVVSYMMGERDSVEHLMSNPRYIFDEMKKHKNIKHFDYHSDEKENE